MGVFRSTSRCNVAALLSMLILTSVLAACSGQPAYPDAASSRADAAASALCGTGGWSRTVEFGQPFGTLGAYTSIYYCTTDPRIPLTDYHATLERLFGDEMDSIQDPEPNSTDSWIGTANPSVTSWTQTSLTLIDGQTRLTVSNQVR